MARESRRPVGVAQPVDIAALIDRLAELASEGRRVRLGGRIMIDEQEFFDTLDLMRLALPNEIGQARRVVQERQKVILAAQAEAEQIVTVARQRAAYMMSDRGLLAEARASAEEVARQSRDQTRRALEEINAHALRVFTNIEHVLREELERVEQAKAQLGQANARPEP